MGRTGLFALDLVCKKIEVTVDFSKASLLWYNGIDPTSVRLSFAEENSGRGRGQHGASEVYGWYELTEFQYIRGFYVKK